MPVKKTPAKAPARTKAEVQHAFSSVQAEVEREREESSPKAAEAARMREDEVRQSVAELTADAARERIASLGGEIGRALSGLSGKIEAEVELLESVREAVAIERRELERLHKIDVAAAAISQMVDDFEQRRRALEEEITQNREAWEAESAARAKDLKEQEDALRKQRQRESEEYEYKKTLDRKKAQDKYDEEIRVQERKNLEKQETLEKSWKTREAGLKEQEESVAKLKAEAAAFPETLKREVERARSEATAQAEAKLEQKILLLEKDAETDRKLAELRIKTLEDLMSRQTAHITALEKQLGETKSQVQDIAVKAIEGASGARALGHINQIAIEQAKNRPGQG